MNENLTFQDILNQNFTQQVQVITDDPLKFVITLVLALVFCAGLYLAYKYSYRGVIFNRSFALSLGLLCLITTLVIMTITSNVILSLGMVGALSIVRFRTAVKDAIDITYMFWAIGLGISTGAGTWIISIALFVLVFAVLLIVNRIIPKTAPYLLVLNLSGKADEKTILGRLGLSVRSYRIKAKSLFKDKSELTIEVNLKAQDQNLIADLGALDGVEKAALLSTDGDYVG